MALKRGKSYTSSIGNISIGGASGNAIGSAFEQAGASFRPRRTPRSTSTEGATEFSMFTTKQSAFQQLPDYGRGYLQVELDNMRKEFGPDNKFVRRAEERLDNIDTISAWSDTETQIAYKLESLAFQAEDFVRKVGDGFHEDFDINAIDEWLNLSMADRDDDRMVLPGFNRKIIGKIMGLDLSRNEETGEYNNRNHGLLFEKEIIPKVIAIQEKALVSQQLKIRTNAHNNEVKLRTHNFPIELNKKIDLAIENVNPRLKLIRTLNILGDEARGEGIWEPANYGAFDETTFRGVAIDTVSRVLILNSSHKEAIENVNTLLDRKGNITLGGKSITFKEFSSQIGFVEQEAVLNQLAKNLQHRVKTVSIAIKREQLKKGTIDAASMEEISEADVAYYSNQVGGGEWNLATGIDFLISKVFHDTPDGGYGGYLGKNMADELTSLMQRGPKEMRMVYEMFSNKGLTVTPNTDRTEKSENFLSMIGAINARVMDDTAGEGYNSIWEDVFGAERLTIDKVAKTLGIQKSDSAYLSDDNNKYSLNELYQGHGIIDEYSMKQLRRNYVEPLDEKINWAEVIFLGPLSIVTEWGKFGEFNYPEGFEDQSALIDGASKYFQMHIKNYGDVRKAVLETQRSLARNFTFDPYIDGYWTNAKHSLVNKKFSKDRLFDNDGEIKDIRTIIDKEYLSEFINPETLKNYKVEDIELGKNLFLSPINEATITNEGNTLTGVLYQMFLRTDGSRILLRNKEGAEIIHFETFTDTKTISEEERDRITMQENARLKLQIDREKYRITF